LVSANCTCSCDASRPYHRPDLHASHQIVGNWRDLGSHAVSEFDRLVRTWLPLREIW
jgi:hypothetical protein